MVPKWCHYDGMDLTPYVDTLRRELAVAAEAGGEEARELAERLTAPLESATRLTMLNVLGRDGRDHPRPRTGLGRRTAAGLDPDFVVTPPPNYGDAPTEPPRPSNRSRPRHRSTAMRVPPRA